ncbi:MAG: threonine/serine exporter family protein [Myxococcaceae bacterium]
MRPTESISTHMLLDYLVELGSSLMSSGCPTHRLEQLLMVIARHEGFTADVFALPTGIFVGLRTPQGDPSAVSMVRVTDWATDLEKMADLDALLNQVIDRKLTIPDARARIKEIEKRPRRWPLPVRLLAGTGAASGAAVSSGGDWRDALLAGLGGLGLSALTEMADSPGVRVLENFIGGVIAALVAWGATFLWPSHSRDLLVLSIIIPLLPGLTLTTGLSEVTYRNLVAGSARLMHAAVTLLSLVFGIALVVNLESSLGFHSTAPIPTEPASLPLQLVALVIATVSFGVLLKVPVKQLPTAVVAGAMTWGMSQATRHLNGAHAAFLAALVLAVGANLYARFTSKPAQLFLLPGLLILVPGALSFRSLDALLRGDYLAGANQFADVLVTAGALAMGLLVANVVAAPRKIL